jgi:superfamily II DNA or RNA helicase
MKQCTLIIKDEVNVKLEGLDVVDRRNLVKMFEYEKPGARYMPAVRLGRWNGKVPYFQLGGSTYINLLPEILPYLEEHGYDIEVEDLRDYQTNFTFDRVDSNTFAHKTWPAGHERAGQPVVLRDYQEQIINRFLENPQSIQEIATGAGKTLITATLSHCVEQYGRSIVIVPNKSLIVQTEADYNNLGLDVGVYYGDRKDFGKQHTICTWQSLNNLLKDTQSGEVNFTIGEFIEGVVLIMIDEAHGAQADALKVLLGGVFARVPLRWGLTGTVPKDKFASAALEVNIGPVIDKLSASELQDKNVLARCHVNVVQLQDNVELGNYQSELKHLLEDTRRLDTLGDIITKIVETGNTLILVDRIAAGHELLARLPGSVFVSGSTKVKDRKEEYDEVATADDKIIIATYGVAAVGLNIPRIFNLILVEPGKSFVRVIQSIGRGIRKAEDKDFVQIWDLTSNCRFSKRHLTVRKAFYREANYPFDVAKHSYK